MNWAENYVGTSQKDCWQFIREVYEKELSIELPEFSGIMIDNIREITRTMEIQSKNNMWTRVSTPIDLNVVALSKGSFIHHVGIYTELDQGKILHAFQGALVAAHDEVQLKKQGFKRIEYYELCSINSNM